MSKPDPASIKTELRVKLSDHEVLISFNDDSDAEDFEVWWEHAGHEAFRSWCEKARGEASGADCMLPLPVGWLLCDLHLGHGGACKSEALEPTKESA